MPPSPNPSALNNCSGFLGDPTGNGVFSPDLFNAQGGTATTTTDSISANDAANDTPATNNGLVDIRVTGTFPIEDAPPSTTNLNYFGVRRRLHYTLPADWAKLAGILATSSTQNTAVQPDLWDIHGGPTNIARHHVSRSSSICTVPTATTSSAAALTPWTAA